MISDPTCVLDASALLAVMQREVGADAVEDHVPRACISAVNLSEVVAKMRERDWTAQHTDDAIAALHLDVRKFGEAEAMRAGHLRLPTRRFGLSLGDRACLALASALSLPVLTTDRAWTKLDIGVEVKLVR